jgi:hypothetical protein
MRFLHLLRSKIRDIIQTFPSWTMDAMDQKLMTPTLLLKSGSAFRARTARLTCKNVK